MSKDTTSSLQELELNVKRLLRETNVSELEPSLNISKFSGWVNWVTEQCDVMMPKLIHSTAEGVSTLNLSLTALLEQVSANFALCESSHTQVN